MKSQFVHQTSDTLVASIFITEELVWAFCIPSLRFFLRWSILCGFSFFTGFNGFFVHFLWKVTCVFTHNPRLLSSLWRAKVEGVVLRSFIGTYAVEAFPFGASWRTWGWKLGFMSDIVALDWLNLDADCSCAAPSDSCCTSHLHVIPAKKSLCLNKTAHEKTPNAFVAKLISLPRPFVQFEVNVFVHVDSVLSASHTVRHARVGLGPGLPITRGDPKGQPSLTRSASPEGWVTAVFPRHTSSWW